MLKSRKVLIGVVAAVLLVGTMGGVVFAADGGDGDGHGNGPFGAHLERICELYEEKTGTALDQDVLVEVMGEVREEMLANAPERPEGAPERFKGEMGSGDRVPPTMQDRLQQMVKDGTITQEQADEYQQWLDSKPDVGVGVGFGFRGHRGACIPPARPPAE